MSEDVAFEVDLDDLAVDAATWTEVSTSITTAKDTIATVLDVPVGGTGGPGYLASLETVYGEVAQSVSDLLVEGIASIDNLSTRLLEAQDEYDTTEQSAIQSANAEV